MNKLPKLKVLLSSFRYDEETGLLYRQSTGKIAGTTNGRGYRQVSVNGKIYMVHRIIWKMHYKKSPKDTIDHKDRNKLNNRIPNLRIATNSQNQFNTQIHSHNKSGVKGVFFDMKYLKWSVLIIKEGKSHFGGRFRDKEHAINRAKELRLKLHGEYSNLA